MLMCEEEKVESISLKSWTFLHASKIINNIYFNDLSHKSWFIYETLSNFVYLTKSTDMNFSSWNPEAGISQVF